MAVLSDSHLASCFQGAPLIPLHLLARKIEREAPSIRKHSKGRKAANFSTGFVVTHLHLIGFHFCFFQAWLGFGAPTSSSGDLNLSVNHTVSQMDSSSEGGILVIGNLRHAFILFCMPPLYHTPILSIVCSYLSFARYTSIYLFINLLAAFFSLVHT